MASKSPSIKELIFSLTTDEGCQKGLRFQPRQSDVIIGGPPRCGTTWTQQIVHQLRTGGDTDFPGIYAVVPWIEAAHDAQLDLDADQKAEPRLYKSHVSYKHIPKGCKYIVIYRNPCAAAYSFFRFKEGLLFKKGTVSVDDFVINTWLTLGDPENTVKPYDVSYFSHLLSWMEHRNDPNVLMLFFEEMKEDLESVVRAIAAFMGIQDVKKIQAATEMSSLTFMKKNAEKFDVTVPSPPTLRETSGPELYFQVVRTGSANEAQNILSDEVKASIHERWREEITKVTGYQSYEELRRAVRKELPLVF